MEHYDVPRNGPRRSQRVSVPSHHILDQAPPAVLAFWEVVKEVRSLDTCENRDYLRHAIVKMRTAHEDVIFATQNSYPNDINIVHDRIIDEIRQRIVQLIADETAEELSDYSFQTRSIAPNSTKTCQDRSDVIKEKPREMTTQQRPSNSNDTQRPVTVRRGQVPDAREQEDYHRWSYCEPAQRNQDNGAQRRESFSSSSAQHQSELAALASAITDSMYLSRVPAVKLPIFNGEPLEYRTWRTSYDMIIQQKNLHPREKLLFLKQSVGPKVAPLVVGLEYLDTEECLRQVLCSLEERFGDDIYIANGYRRKLGEVKHIHYNDNRALQEYADLLSQIQLAYDNVAGLRVLDDPQELIKLAQKLPEHTKRKWANKMFTLRDDYGRQPSFREFVNFVFRESRTYNDPHIAQLFQYKEPVNKTRGCLSTAVSKEGSRSTSSTSPKENCTFCKKGVHKLDTCTSFSKQDAKAKNNFIRENNLCYACLKTGHSSSRCRHKARCDKCKRRHPTVVHGLYEELYENNKSETTYNKRDRNIKSKQYSASKDSQCKAAKTEDTPLQTDSTSTMRTRNTNVSRQIYTMVLPVYVSSVQDAEKEILTYALLDSQSDTTFVTESVAESLTDDYTKCNLSLTTMCNTTDVQCKKYNGLTVRGMNSATIIKLPPSYGRHQIPGDYEQIGTDETAKKYKHLQEIEDQLPQLQSCQFGLLIGCDCAAALIPSRIIAGTPYAQQTPLGWSIVGRDDLSSTTLKTTLHRDVCIEDQPKEVVFSLYVSQKDQFAHITKILESDFKEDKGEDKTASKDDLQFMRIVESSIHQNEERFYEMSLPIKDRSQVLPNNRVVAAKRLTCLKQKFKKNEQYFKDYKTFMSDIIANRVAEEVPREEINNDKSWYIPHHGIYARHKPKIRVVFDCSSMYKGTSLNQYLLQGPDFMNSLVGILTRFRREPVAFIGDVQQMFHRFQVAPDDRDYLRFLWFRGGDLDREPTIYRMKVFVFGAVCSPSCASYALKKLAVDHSTDATKAAASYIDENFYVDDGLLSVKSETEAIKIIADARMICAKANVRLHKFVSNNNNVLASIPISERAEPSKLHDLSFEKEQLDKVLGIQWSTATDSFHFKLNVPEKPDTRRGMLSIVASLYDPLGLLAPFTLRGKLILQALCKASSGWDEPITGPLKGKWEEWLAELHQLEDVSIARCYKPAHFGNVKEYEIHHFSDASYQAYGQCSYIRMINDNNQIHCALVMAKARVAPQKALTIVRLELMAAVTSARISAFLRQQLRYDQPIREFYWTDSMIVLAYLQNDAKKFHVFVSNRVQTILDHSTVNQWRHVPTQSNPADHCSRGLYVKELVTSNWLNGPAFLWNPLPEPTQVSSELPGDHPEVRRVTVHKICTMSTKVLHYVERFSDWYRAVKCISLLRKPFLIKRNNLPASEVQQFQDAEMCILRQCQAKYFDTVILSVMQKSTIKISQIESLDPFLDDSKILRVGGRLSNSSLDYGVKHPILLPKQGHVTYLLIKHFHERTHHQGRGMTINMVRSHGYFVIGISRLVATLIYRCVHCRRMRHQPQLQKMSNLPPERMEPAPPFTVVAIDCFGPYYVTERRSELKRYGLVVVCQASRAIHLEVLDDLTTDCFLNGLRCVIAIRGSISTIRCDQGSNFIGASAELKKSYTQVDCEKVTKALQKDQVQFVFTTPESSHMSGTVERQIRSVRSILSAILHEHSKRLDTSSLRTLMYEVMALVNSRPLSSTHLHDKNLEPLTPNHLITMKSRVMSPQPGQFEPADIYTRKRWRRVQELTNQFWRRWRAEYLLDLQNRQKWTTVKRDMCIGDIVLLKDESYRGDWRIAKVIEILSSTDQIRRVRLLMGERGTATKRTYLERPIHKLVLLLEKDSLD